MSFSLTSTLPERVSVVPRQNKLDPELRRPKKERKKEKKCGCDVSEESCVRVRVRPPLFHLQLRASATHPCLLPSPRASSTLCSRLCARDDVQVTRLAGQAAVPGSCQRRVRVQASAVSVLPQASATHSIESRQCCSDRCQQSAASIRHRYSASSRIQHTEKGGTQLIYTNHCDDASSSSSRN